MGYSTAIRRKSEGKCTRCESPAVEGKTLCQNHLDRGKEQSVKRRVANASNGHCVRCNQPSDGKALCAQCREKDRTKSKVRRDQGQCQCCDHPVVPGKAMCQVHLEMKKSNWSKRVEARKKNGICVSCGRLPPMKDTTYCRNCSMKNRATTLGVTVEELDRLWKKQDGKCRYLKVRLDAEDAWVDHRIPRAGGGKDEIENYQWTHRDVNLMKHDLSETNFFLLVKRIYECNDLANWNP